MKTNLRATVGAFITFALIAGFSSCGSNQSGNSKGTDTAANMTKSADGMATDSTATNGGNTNGRENENTAGGRSEGENERNKMHKPGERERLTSRATEPTSDKTLNIASTAFANGGMIPVKYTCDGQGATPPLTVTNIPTGSRSLTLIVQDYEATDNAEETYWIIWNLDTSGIIPENFTNDHEATNNAKQYGYKPVCANSGNHRYHFIFYALDTKLVLGKNTTKAMIENVMRGHVLAKGDFVGIYNKHLE